MYLFLILAIFLSFNLKPAETMWDKYVEDLEKTDDLGKIEQIYDKHMDKIRQIMADLYKSNSPTRELDICPSTSVSPATSDDSSTHQPASASSSTPEARPEPQDCMGVKSLEEALATHAFARLTQKQKTSLIDPRIASLKSEMGNTDDMNERTRIYLKIARLYELKNDYRIVTQILHDIIFNEDAHIEHKAEAKLILARLFERGVLATNPEEFAQHLDCATQLYKEILEYPLGRDNRIIRLAELKLSDPQEEDYLTLKAMTVELRIRFDEFLRISMNVLNLLSMEEIYFIHSELNKTQILLSSDCSPKVLEETRKTLKDIQAKLDVARDNFEAKRHAAYQLPKDDA